MALDPQGVSVKAMVSSYEARGVPRGCGCCALPDTGNPRHRGCASPAPSRGSSPAHAPTMPALGALGSRPGGTDKALLSLLVCVHRYQWGAGGCKLGVRGIGQEWGLRVVGRGAGRVGGL